MRSSSLSLFVLFIPAACPVGKHHPGAPKPVEEVSPLYDAVPEPFYHGVASGDPLADGVVIRAGVMTGDSVSSIDLVWEMAANDQFDPELLTGAFPGRAFLVSVEG